MLGGMGFGEQWGEWIRACEASASFSIIVNCAPKGFFSSSRGICQGDPLSCLLLVIVAESLSGILCKANEVGLFNGFSVENSMSQIPHL